MNGTVRCLPDGLTGQLSRFIIDFAEEIVYNKKTCGKTWQTIRTAHSKLPSSWHDLAGALLAAPLQWMSS